MWRFSTCANAVDPRREVRSLAALEPPPSRACAKKHAVISPRVVGNVLADALFPSSPFPQPSLSVRAGVGVLCARRESSPLARVFCTIANFCPTLTRERGAGFFALVFEQNPRGALFKTVSRIPSASASHRATPNPPIARRQHPHAIPPLPTVPDRPEVESIRLSTPRKKQTSAWMRIASGSSSFLRECPLLRPPPIAACGA